MPKIIVNKEFRYAIDGINIKTFPIGEYDATDDVAEYAVKDRFAVYDGGPESIAVPKLAVKREKK